MRFLLVLLGALLVAWPCMGEPSVGDPLPDVTFIGPGGVEIATGDFAGQRGLVLAWFPLAFTGG